MPSFNSRQRFREYLRQLRERRESKKEGGKEFDGPLGRPAQQRSFFTLFREFLKLLAGNRAAIGFSLFTLTVSTLLKLAPPAATKLTIDYVLTDKPLPPQWQATFPADRFERLYWLAALVVSFSVVETALGLWGRWFATRTTQHVAVSIRRRVFEHAVRLPLHRIYQLKSGGAASILREDAGSVAELIFSMLYNPWSAIIQLTGSLLVLAWVDWRLLLGSFVLFPVVYLTHRTWIARIRPLYRDVRNRRQEIDSHATEAFGGMRVVRAFGRQRSETGRFVRSGHLLSRQQLYVWWWARIVEVIWEILIPVASAGLLLYGGGQVLRGELSLGDLMMFLFYLAMLLGPLAVLANSAAGFQNSLSGLDRILDLLAEPREMPASANAVSLKKADVAGRLTLSNVDFHYPTANQTVLTGIDLDIQPGETVALVGRSGAGKTTLCNLVARFYDPTSGRIELDGVDLRDIEVESYRRLLGIVEQDVFLFDGSVSENIGYAVRGATRDQIEQAARAANADQFIRDFELGYDTIIGERGVKLSGGQRQRLAIARALLADPRILILDEATSNLDSESEQLIQQSLHALMQSRTSLVIAHRLSTIVHADRIVVLEGGQIIESGTHSELLAQNGRYRQMVELQMGVEGLSTR